MGFIAWINKLGALEVARLLDVDRTTVDKWYSLKATPQFDNAVKIKQLTNGKLGFEEIYGPRYRHILAQQK